MMTTLRFVVEGKVRGKERPRVGKGGNIYTPRTTKQAEAAIKWAAKGAGARPTHAPMALSVWMHVKGRRKIDGDNVAKLVGDALNGIAYDDDRQVLEWHVYRVPTDGDERIEVEVRELGGLSA